MKIDIDAKRQAEMYWGPGPIPGEIVGMVEGENFRKGALILLKSGVYVQGNAGSIRTLPQRDVKRLLEG
jgi:hypothetical protein